MVLVVERFVGKERGRACGLNASIEIDVDFKVRKYWLFPYACTLAKPCRGAD